MSLFKNLFKGNKDSQDTDQNKAANYKKALQKETTNEIEQLYVDSFDDMSKLKEFFDLFKVTDFYFAGTIEGDIKRNNDGSVVSDENTKLKFNMFDIQGQPMCAFFTSFEKMKKSLGAAGVERFIKLKFRNFFTSENKNTFIMNPGFAMAKVFPNEHVVGILDGSLIKSIAPGLKEGTKLQIGIPNELPEEFFKELVLYASKIDAIKEIYYALLNDEENGLRIALAIKFTEDTKESNLYLGDIQQLVQENGVNYGGFIDITKLKDDNELAMGIKQAGERLY